MEQERPWLALCPSQEPGQPVNISGMHLFNISAVRRVDVSSWTEIRLVFEPSHIEIIRGAGATEILALLLERALLPDGKPFPISKEFESQESASLLDPGQGS